MENPDQEDPRWYERRSHDLLGTIYLTVDILILNVGTRANDMLSAGEPASRA